MNGRLPRDIWTWAWAVAPLGFSARWNAQWREYRYLLWHPGLDLELMRSAAEMLKGEHDFRNFSSLKVDTVRKMQKLEISGEAGLGLVTSIFGPTAFSGTWCERSSAPWRRWVGGEGLEWFADLLRPELNYGAPTAPAEGLILMDVGYDGLDWQVDEYSRGGRRRRWERRCRAGWRGRAWPGRWKGRWRV